jgi:hypothetical protein
VYLPLQCQLFFQSKSFPGSVFTFQIILALRCNICVILSPRSMSLWGADCGFSVISRPGYYGTGFNNYLWLQITLCSLSTQLSDDQSVGSVPPAYRLDKLREFM